VLGVGFDEGVTGTLLGAGAVDGALPLCGLFINIYNAFP
jgi:hypothetical protein